MSVTKRVVSSFKEVSPMDCDTSMCVFDHCKDGSVEDIIMEESSSAAAVVVDKKGDDVIMESATGSVLHAEDEDVIMGC